jgi:hypothetical protein
MCCHQAHSAGLHKQNMQEAGLATGEYSMAPASCTCQASHARDLTFTVCCRFSSLRRTWG